MTPPTKNSIKEELKKCGDSFKECETQEHVAKDSKKDAEELVQRTEEEIEYMVSWLQARKYCDRKRYEYLIPLAVLLGSHAHGGSSC